VKQQRPSIISAIHAGQMTLCMLPSTTGTLQSIHSPLHHCVPLSQISMDIVYLSAGNVYAYMPPSAARNISITLMCVHQVVAYGLVRIQPPPHTRKQPFLHHTPENKTFLHHTPEHNHFSTTPENNHSSTTHQKTKHYSARHRNTIIPPPQENTYFSPTDR
jgi:hypothetical protein